MSIGNKTAFPVPLDCQAGGMTRRELFAAMMMQGLMMNSSWDENTLGDCANQAVLAADELIAKIDIANKG